MKIGAVDVLLENLEIMADDNYYPIEDNDDYKLLCYMIEKSNIDEEIDDDDVKFYVKNILREIKSYF